MSDMVAIVLKMTLGLFVKKAQSALSKKLKDGGLNSQQLRSLITSKLEVVKTELVGLARGNLLSSASFIQEGLGILDHLLDKPNSPSLPPQEDDDKVGENSSGACSSDQASSSSNDSPLNVDSALKVAGAINQMKISSTDHFTAAMELFKNANTKATEAFHNEALNLEDRILAAKLRVQSRLLLSLENPSLASQPCRLYLEELHGLASIVEDFHTDLEGGMLSFFNKEKRRELVLSVSAINFVVFNFLKSFTKGPINVYDWPNLKSGDWTYNPSIPDRTICMELRDAGIEHPNIVVLEGFDLCKKWRDVAVKSNGDLTAGRKNYCGHGSPNVIFDEVTMNKPKPSVFSHHDKCARSHVVLFLAVDINDNIYLLTDDHCTQSGSATLRPKTCTLRVFDSKKHEIAKIWVGYCPGDNILVPTPNGIAVMSNSPRVSDRAEVAFYKNEKGNVQKTSSFETKLWGYSLVTVTNKYQVVAVEKRGYRVRVYEKDGQLIREFELCRGEDESCLRIAFNFLTEELVVVSRVGSWYFLSTYEPETGKLRHNVRLSLFGKIKEDKIGKIWLWKFEYCLRLTAHCSGPMALVSGEYVLYLQ